MKSLLIIQEQKQNLFIVQTLQGRKKITINDNERIERLSTKAVSKTITRVREVILADRR